MSIVSGAFSLLNLLVNKTTKHSQNNHLLAKQPRASTALGDFNVT